MIVLDASAALDYLIPIEPQGSWVARRILEPGQTLHAPHLIDVELAAALRRRGQTGELSGRAGKAILQDLFDLDMTRYPHVMLLDRIWELRNNHTAYDAAYVALAEILGAALVTTDQALARSASHRARIDGFPG